MVSLLIALIILGAALYLIGILPIDATVKQVIYVIAIVAMVVWLLRTFGGMAGLG